MRAVPMRHRSPHAIARGLRATSQAGLPLAGGALEAERDIPDLREITRRLARRTVKKRTSYEPSTATRSLSVRGSIRMPPPTPGRRLSSRNNSLFSILMTDFGVRHQSFDPLEAHFKLCDLPILFQNPCGVLALHGGHCESRHYGSLELGGNGIADSLEGSE